MSLLVFWSCVLHGTKQRIVHQGKFNRDWKAVVVMCPLMPAFDSTGLSAGSKKRHWNLPIFLWVFSRLFKKIKNRLFWQQIEASTSLWQTSPIKNANSKVGGEEEGAILRVWKWWSNIPVTEIVLTSPEAVIWQNTPSHGASCDLPSLFSGIRLFWTLGHITQPICANVQRLSEQWWVIIFEIETQSLLLMVSLFSCVGQLLKQVSLMSTALL